MALGQHKSKRVGLSRALSKLGYCSRSEAAKLIQTGRVRLNGTPHWDPEAPVRLQRDRIEVDGREVEAESPTYLMLNKPRGVVTTASDEKGRETVYSCLAENSKWVAPIGRLDKASEGLLLLTNDSDWAARIADPATHLAKVYHVQIAGTVDRPLLQAMGKGIRVKNGEILRATRSEILRVGPRNTWLAITLDEGKNRHIRRMLESGGKEVLRLVRVSIGPLELGDLPKGSSRHLTRDEKMNLDAALRANVSI